MSYPLGDEKSIFLFCSIQFNLNTCVIKLNVLHFSDLAYLGCYSCILSKALSLSLSLFFFLLDSQHAPLSWRPVNSLKKAERLFG